eukprot:SAG31_NODE_872_length_11329_cov_3.968655_8_plen_91_part_00
MYLSSQQQYRTRSVRRIAPHARLNLRTHLSCAAHLQDSWNVLVRGDLLPEPADGDATAKFSSFVEKVCIHGVPDEPKLEVRRAVQVTILA